MGNNAKSIHFTCKIKILLAYLAAIVPLWLRSEIRRIIVSLMAVFIVKQTPRKEKNQDFLHFLDYTPMFWEFDVVILQQI